MNIVVTGQKTSPTPIPDPYDKLRIILSFIIINIIIIIIIILSSSSVFGRVFLSEGPGPNHIVY